MSYSGELEPLTAAWICWSAPSVDAVAAPLQAGGQRAAIVEATRGGLLRAADLRARPLAALAAISGLLLLALAILRISEQPIAIGRPAGRRAVIRRSTGRRPRSWSGRSRTTIDVGGRRIRVQCRRRRRHHVAAGRRVIGVIDIVVVVVRDRVPPVGRAERGQHRQEPGKAGAPEHTGPIAAVPVAPAPASIAPGVSPAPAGIGTAPAGIGDRGAAIPATGDRAADLGSCNSVIRAAARHAA